MSAATSTIERGPSTSPWRTWLTLGGIMLAAVLVASLLSGASERELRRSAIGFDGLAAWLRAEDLAARTHIGWSEVDASAVGLRVLPLFDAVLDADRQEVETEEELLLRLSEVDMTARVLRRKLETLPTLLVLHKWRTGMRLTRIAHPVVIGDPALQTRLLADIAPGLGEVRIVPRALTAFDVAPDARLGAGATVTGAAAEEAQLYLPQVITGADACRPIIGTRRAMVLGRCVTGDKRAGEDVRHFWLLADPDLMNNHGLTLGANAALATRLIDHMADGALTVVDYTTHVWATGPQPRREREWSDLLRFFAWPFTILWLGAAIVMALVLWRAGIRNAAPLGASGMPQGAAKAVSIDAQARIMRLSGADGALLHAYVTQRLAMLADQIMGARRPAGDPARPIADWLARRGIGEGAALSAATDAARALPRTAPAAQVAERLDDFETALEKVLNDLGRPPRHG
ncbi:MAG: hypothetical protein AAF899_00700 [Pseudomonadota bacterium]